MPHVLVEDAEGPIARVILARPKVNAMDGELLSEMAEAFRSLDGDDQVRGVLVLGEGKSFSAGLDLMHVASLDEAGTHAFLDVLDEAFTAAFRFSKPMAVALQGHAIAGGMVLALCADYLALGSGSYKVGLTELAVGVPFPRTAYEIVAAALPPRALRKVVNLAGTHPPQEIFDMGIGDDLADDPLASANTWLETVSARPLATFRHVKRLRRGAAWKAIDEQTLSERRALVGAISAAKAALTGALG